MISVGNKDIPQIASIFLLTISFFINIYTIFNLIYFFTGNRIDIGFNSKLIAAAETLVVTSIFYFIYIRKNKYLEIVEYYKNETKNERKNGKLTIILYFLSTYIFLFFTVFLMIKKNKGEL